MFAVSRVHRCHLLLRDHLLVSLIRERSSLRQSLHLLVMIEFFQAALLDLAAQLLRSRPVRVLLTEGFRRIRQ